jgi:hypothetical protein
MTTDSHHSLHPKKKQFEEPDNSPSYVCACAGFGTGTIVKDGLEVNVESSDKLTDMSYLTQDSAILNSYTNNGSLVEGGDVEDLQEKSGDDAGIKKPSWLVSTLKRRNSKQDLYRMSKSASTSCLMDLGVASNPSSPNRIPSPPSPTSVVEQELSMAPTISGEFSFTDDDIAVTRPIGSSKATKSLTLNLDEYDDNQFELMVQHIKGRSDLARLEVYRNTPSKKGRKGRDMSDLGRFFSEVGGLSSLQEVVLWNFTPECAWLLTCFLKERPALKSFRLHHARGTASQDLLKALAQLPTLTKLVLEMQYDFPVDILLTSTSLRSLKIDGSYTLSQNNMARSMRILGRNKTLKSLDLKPFVTDLGIHELVSAIQINKTLEKLSFSYRSPSIRASGDALLDMAKTLSQNRTLKEVVNRRYRSVAVSNDVRCLADEFLQASATLERFQFYNGSACVEDAVVEDDSLDKFLEETSNKLECSTSSIQTQTVPWLRTCGVIDVLTMCQQ